MKATVYRVYLVGRGRVARDLLVLVAADDAVIVSSEVSKLALDGERIVGMDRVAVVDTDAAVFVLSKSEEARLTHAG